MANKIFVGNLPFSTTAGDLETLFMGYGAIQGVNLRKDRRTNQPRGFGFVTFMEESSARAAVSALQGQAFQGRVLTVNTADARGTAAASAASNKNSSTDNDNSGEEEDDVEWKTAPPARKNNDKSKNKGSTNNNNNNNNKNNNSKSNNSKKKVSRSWDEWAAPTAKVSQRQVPQSVPLVSPEAEETNNA